MPRKKDPDHMTAEEELRSLLQWAEQMRVHRLDRIIANKPAKLLDSRSLTLGFRVKQIWPVYFMFPAHVDYFRMPRKPSGANTSVNAGRQGRIYRARSAERIG